MAAFCMETRSAWRTNPTASDGIASSSDWGSGALGVGLLEPCAEQSPVCLNLHTARLFDPEIDLPAGPYRLHNIQASQALEPEDALRVTAGWA